MVATTKVEWDLLTFPKPNRWHFLLISPTEKKGSFGSRKADFYPVIYRLLPLLYPPKTIGFKGFTAIFSRWQQDISKKKIVVL